MELAQELLFTVSLALLFSFLVAKLVSLAMAADLKSAQNVDDHIVANEVRFVETETRVESVDGGSGLVEETCEITRGGEVPVLPSEEEVSEIVELPENSPRERSGHEIMGFFLYLYLGKYFPSNRHLMTKFELLSSIC
ncbi:unnamed protein product, partial [Vitis vinifera]|uniref:Uncharacterized protein n=1 Tax=Vitis vinifera TaxID=29760 RepID=D7TT44_VITVI